VSTIIHSKQELDFNKTQGIFKVNYNQIRVFWIVTHTHTALSLPFTAIK